MLTIFHSADNLVLFYARRSILSWSPGKAISIDSVRLIEFTIERPTGVCSPSAWEILHPSYHITSSQSFFATHTFITSIPRHYVYQSTNYLDRLASFHPLSKFLSPAKGFSNEGIDSFPFLSVFALIGNSILKINAGESIILYFNE